MYIILLNSKTYWFLHIDGMVNNFVNFFRAPIRLPENVVVDVVIVTKKEGVLTHRVIAEELTSTYKDIGMRCERDAFDTLFDHAPDKLQVGTLF